MATAAGAQAPALRGLDPIALCAGQETPGEPELSETRGGYTYRFATAANRATFVADPARYEIQLGGACARMGPLSGLGDSDRYLVHDGRIYIFASDGCRDGFAKRPERFLDVDVPAPEPAAELAAAGERLLDKAIGAHGGRARLTGWRHFRHAHTVATDDATQEFRVWLELPLRLRIDHDYRQGDRTWRYARVLDGDIGHFIEEGKPREMAPAARVEMLRAALRDPLFALRAACDGAHVAIARARNDVAGVAVDELELWQRGCTTIFGLDERGLLRTARFRGRGPGLWFGDVVLVFDDYRDVGGLMVPFAVNGTFDGAPTERLTERREHVAVDAELPAGTFARPK